MKKDQTTETKHKELLALLNPLIDFMIENNLNYFLVAGKDGTCTRHMRGHSYDVISMISGMMDNNDQVKKIIEDSVTLNNSKK